MLALRFLIPAVGALIAGVAALFSTDWSQPGNPNLVGPTMGGQQVWTDKLYHVGWRIQRNVLTGHHRLLDPEDRRHAWGTYDDCLARFDAIRTTRTIDYGGKPVAFLVKGLGGMEGNFREMKKALSDDGYHVAYVSYPSTRQGITDHARDISHLLNGLEGVQDIVFVAHSMGGLVMRQVLADGGDWMGRMNVHGLVMIGTPNKGSQMAESFYDNGAFAVVTTEAGQDLRPDHVATLPPVTIRHCLIIGSNNDGQGLNPLIDGDDDGVIGVAEAMLEGSDDVLIVEARHQQLLEHPEAILGIRRFLDEGFCRRTA